MKAVREAKWGHLQPDFRSEKQRWRLYPTDFTVSLWISWSFFFVITAVFFSLSLFSFSNTHTKTRILTEVDSDREEDGWHVSGGEAANVICYNSALISIFSNLPRDLYLLPEPTSILTESRPAPQLCLCHMIDVFPGLPNISRGRLGLCQAWLILYSQLHDY